MVGAEAVGLIGMNLTDQDERVPHQDTRQPDQAEDGIESKRLMKNQQRRHSANQSEWTSITIHMAENERTWMMMTASMNRIMIGKSGASAKLAFLSLIHI